MVPRTDSGNFGWLWSDEVLAATLWMGGGTKTRLENSKEEVEKDNEVSKHDTAVESCTECVVIFFCRAGGNRRRAGHRREFCFFC